MQALATKERRETSARLGDPVPPALQAPRPSTRSTATARFLPGATDPEDRQVLRAPRDNPELMESQGIPVRMEKPVLMDHLASQEPQGTLDQQEQRETVEMVNLAPGDSLDLQEPDTDLLLWTWKALGSLIWTPSGDRLVYRVLPVPPAPPVQLIPRQREQHRVLGRSDHQERTGRPVNLACLVCRGWMDVQELSVPMEKRVI